MFFNECQTSSQSVMTMRPILHATRSMATPNLFHVKEWPVILQKETNFNIKKHDRTKCFFVQF